MAVLVIAEDDEDIALVMVRMFKRAGLEVLRAPDGEQALDVIVAERPDVVVTDLGMPRMDGWQLIEAVRAHPEVRETPIAILSGHLQAGDPRAAAARVCAILLKPCPNDRLLAVVEELVATGPHEHGVPESRCPADLPVSV
jgi:CheY-like chemotaxis protein